MKLRCYSATLSKKAGVADRDFVYYRLVGVIRWVARLMCKLEYEWLTNVLGTAQQHAESVGSLQISDAIEEVLTAASVEMDALSQFVQPCGVEIERSTS